MLTPVDITNRVFKGGIGYDKKDVEAFMLELSTDYRELYSSNVELKDKIATLNESLQHYRSIEDSMQKAMTLSEKTAEETVSAASDKARQINIEAEMKAEAILADAKAELQSTKDDIYRLQRQYETFKQQFTKILDMQKKLMDGEMIDIDLGADFEPSPGLFGGNSGGLGSEGGLGGGLGSGTYVGSNDIGRERTNQDPAFDRGSLNMDPFADAANGGGRFSKQTGGVYTGAKKKAAKQNPNSQLSVGKSSTKQSKPVQTETNSSKPVQTETPPVQPKTSTVTPGPKTQTVSKEDIIAAVKAAHEAEQAAKQAEQQPETPVQPTPVQPQYSTEQPKEDTYVGEVENKLNESHMLDSEDNYASGGFDFVVDDSQAEEEIPTIFTNPSNMNSFNANDDVLVGDVEENVKQSNLIGNDDDKEEGFNFL